MCFVADIFFITPFSYETLTYLDEASSSPQIVSLKRVPLPWREYYDIQKKRCENNLGKKTSQIKNVSEKKYQVMLGWVRLN